MLRLTQRKKSDVNTNGTTLKDSIQTREVVSIFEWHLDYGRRVDIFLFVLDLFQILFELGQLEINIMI